MENFAGLSSPYSDYDFAKAVVIPVPYDATSTWVRGSEKGPEALLDASVTLEWYDLETRTEAYKNGIHTCEPILEDSTPESLCDAVESKVENVIADGKLPFVIGGNHTVSIGAIRAVAKRYDDLTVLQLDAHSDLRPFYEGSELNHACVMNQAQRLCSTTQVGIRSMCIEETPFAEKSNIFYAHNIMFENDWQKSALDTLKQNVYITIDLDVFDPSVLPSTGTPEPGGMYYYQVLHFLRSVIANHNIVGIDIVELCPNEKERASDYLAARLAYQLLTYQFNK
ncbi:MAG: agmatinase [Bacteroidales bacterium]